MQASSAGMAIACALLVQVAAPSQPGATTLVRRGLDRLVDENELIVMGRVLDLHSYWNADHDFILTDVTLRPSQVLKGQAPEDLTFTVMGGSVGDVTTLIIAGPDLEPGREYLLFLARADLPGAPARMTVRDHVQGVFAVERGRAVSQAAAHVLSPDDTGLADAAGGPDGMDVEELVRRVLDRTGGR